MLRSVSHSVPNRARRRWPDMLIRCPQHRCGRNFARCGTVRVQPDRWTTASVAYSDGPDKPLPSRPLVHAPRTDFCDLLIRRSWALSPPPEPLRDPHSWVGAGLRFVVADPTPGSADSAGSILHDANSCRCYCRRCQAGESLHGWLVRCFQACDGRRW